MEDGLSRLAKSKRIKHSETEYKAELTVLNVHTILQDPNSHVILVNVSVLGAKPSDPGAIPLASTYPPTARSSIIFNRMPHPVPLAAPTF